MGENTANPAPHGQLWRTVSCHALIPLVLAVGGLALAGALLLQGLAKVGRSLHRLEGGVVLLGVALAVLGLVTPLDSVWGVLLVGGSAVPMFLVPTAREWDRLQSVMPVPPVRLAIGLASIAALLFILGKAIIDDRIATISFAIAGLLLASTQTLSRLEDRRPSFRPISVKRTK